MSITDELREYAEKNECKSYRKLLNDIADHIDNAALNERNAAYNNGYDEGFASADDWCADNADELREHGWVRLPFGTDGMPWRIGDRTESGQTIQAMGLNEHGWYFLNTVNEIDPTMHCHYHAPTVEDVLREFADRVCSSDHIVKDGKYLGIEDTALLTDFAAKLRLAGSDAE